MGGGCCWVGSDTSRCVLRLRATHRSLTTCQEFYFVCLFVLSLSILSLFPLFHSLCLLFSFFFFLCLRFIVSLICLCLLFPLTFYPTSFLFLFLSLSFFVLTSLSLLHQSFIPHLTFSVVAFTRMHKYVGHAHTHTLTVPLFLHVPSQVTTESILLQHVSRAVA